MSCSHDSQSPRGDKSASKAIPNPISLIGAVNQTKAKRKSKNSTAESIASQDIAWFESSDDKTSETFFDYFSIFAREEGYLRYERVLRQSSMSKRERSLLTRNFERWKQSEGLTFWERRIAKVTAQKAAWNTAGRLIEGSEPFATTLLAENAQEQWQRCEPDTSTSTRPPSSAPQDPDAGLVAQNAEAEGPISRKRSGTMERTDKGRGVKSRKMSSNARGRAQDHRRKSMPERRAERFECLDQGRFWVLESTGRAVERVLFEASVKSGAPLSWRSYTIDLSCADTKALFSDAEWKEITEQVSFDLPELPRATQQYISQLRLNMLLGQHPHGVPLPGNIISDEDRYDCYLALKTAVEWQFLYRKEPSPFIVDDLSESWWARESWPAWFDLLHDLKGIYMVDGEKRGLDSSRRKNMGRVFQPDEPCRKRAGKKLDLVCRDMLKKHDWLVVERMRVWDPQSTKFLRELGYVILRETITIALNRMSEAPSEFRRTCRFFGGYTGSSGYTTIQLRPATATSYVLLMKQSPLYRLPAEMGDLRAPFQGLVRLLQIRAAMRATIEKYRELHMTDIENEIGDATGVKADVSWMYEEPPEEFDANLLVASSPSVPDDSLHYDDSDGGGL
ncbi:hypothetical protein BGZ72_005465 [Mortierella alpina]|nr:hypothetical protein BGZ72_005465 [Mortierella alpina]